MKSSVGMDLVRSVFATIDRGIYGLIGTLYSYIEKIAEHQLINSTIISNISNKLYSFVAIFMLFKISFSLINYIINPDSLTDKEKGGSKLIVNILITFGLIIVAPFGFDLLYEAQSALLKEHLVSNIFLTDMPTTDKTLYISSLCQNPVMPSTKFDATTLKPIYDEGEYIALITLRPFVQVDDSALSERGETVVNKFLNEKGYCTATNVNELLSQSIINFDDSILSELYIMNYNILLSTIVGIIIVLIFAGFCLDAALRTVKLYFLQIIAPIPIMSYIDPASSKKGLFSKWLKEVGITWVDLFLRLAAVYFAIFIISNIEVNSDGIIMDVLLVLGTLMFAKKLPEILKKMFNIDLKGDFKLNPLKKIQEQALGGKQIAGSATGIAAGTIGLATSFRGNNFKERFSNAGKGFIAGIKGGYKAPNTLKGIGSGMQPYKEIRKKQKEANQQLKQFDEFNERGQKLVKNALKRDENGNIILDKDGKYAIDETKNFKHGEYINSFNNVKQAKGNLKSAKEELTNANADLQRIMSGNLTDDEHNKIKNGDITYDSLYQKAKENATKANENVDKMQGILDGAKERHKIVQSKYTDDALNEKSMKEFMDRNPSKKLEDLGINVNNARITAQSSHNETANNNYNANDPYSVYHKMENDIVQKENELKLKQQQYNQETNMDERNKISGEISVLSQDIADAKNERERFNDKNPSVAADFIENDVIPKKEQEIENYKKERDALYNTFKNPDAAIQNYGENYAAAEEYKKAKQMYDMKETEISKATENLMDLKRRSAQFKAKAQEEIIEQLVNVEQKNEETVEPLFDTNASSSSNSSETGKSEREKRIEYLEGEKRKYLEEMDELRKYYGVPRYKNVKRYPEIEKKLNEIDDELYNL